MTELKLVFKESICFRPVEMQSVSEYNMSACSVGVRSETHFISACRVEVANSAENYRCCRKNFFTYSIFEHCIRVELLCSEGLPPYFEF